MKLSTSWNNYLKRMWLFDNPNRYNFLKTLPQYRHSLLLQNSITKPSFKYLLQNQWKLSRYRLYKKGEVIVEDKNKIGRVSHQLMPWYVSVRKVSNSSFPRRIRTRRQSLVVAWGPNPRAPPRCRSSFCQSDQQLTSAEPLKRVHLKSIP